MNIQPDLDFGRKESEQRVAAHVKDVLASQLVDYVVESGKSILYKIEVDGLGSYAEI